MWNVNWLQLNLDRRAASDGQPPTLTRTAARVYQYAVLLVLPILYLLLFPTPFLPLGLGGVVFLFALRWRARAAPIPRTRINPALLVLFCTVLVGMLRASNLHDATLVVARLVAGAVTF